jgi:hypothetical protein
MKAFPTEHPLIGTMNTFSDGMDLRDYFAAKAMQAILVTRNDAMYLKELPTICYKWADAMMKAREQ